MNGYEVLKALYPITTKAKQGVNVRELIQKSYPEYYEKLRLNNFDWNNDLDGILDFLYGERELGFWCLLFGVPKSAVNEIINLIETNCEVKK